MSFVDRVKKLWTRKPVAETSEGADAGVSIFQQALDATLLGDSPAPVLGDGAKALPDGAETDLISLPLLGQGTVARHQRVLFSLLGVALAMLVLVAAYVLSKADRVGQQMSVTGQSLVQSQRLAKSASLAIVGNPKAFADVVDSVSVLTKGVRGLASGDEQLQVDALPDDYKPELEKLLALVDRAERSAAAVSAQQKTLTQASGALKEINSQSADLLELAENISTLKIQQNAPAAEIAAAGQLVMLTQRIGKSANEFQSTEGANAEAAFLLGKDLNTFRELVTGLLNGNSELRLSAPKDGQVKAQLEALLKAYEQTRERSGLILGNLKGLVAAREAHDMIINDSESLRRGLEDLQVKLNAQSGLGLGAVLLLVAASSFVLLVAMGLARVQLLDSRHRQAAAERQQLQAQQLEQEAKRVNDANQAAILRLMNELQTVAEGDLTQEATVTEDITGAIADSVNYTVEELRALVGNVQNTATLVAQTTAKVDSTSTELLAASTEQLREIRETGRSVLDMASRITGVSSQAQESAAVARQSLQAADSGLQAVQNAIGGMNAIRDQIQETSKRIKRLGESSQEIGEITELISDITEQTNVLALNAAIQAASAGEAGRGFSVVAEEVQRLAERSADATRQIAALVKTIQTDTQDAVAAMERSTQGVVEGARLSDSAGAALSEIDNVSRRLADLIEQISVSTSREAELANGVADNIQHIFAVTEQTGEGTRSTAQQVRELSRMADELRQSVARFKIS